MSVLIAVAALPCGLLIGLLLGALGGGGSVLAVPALVYVLGQSPHEATAGALVVVTVGAVTGLVCHARAGRVRWAAGTAFGALGTAGSYLGSRWSAALDPTVLMAAFAGLMLVVAAMLLLRGRRAARGADGAAPLGVPVPQGAGAATPTRTRPARVAATASAVGLLTGFFGVGGGFVVVPALTLVLGLEMPVAIGTSLLVILINSLTALGTRAGAGTLDWPLLAGFAACAAVGSNLGNRLTARLHPQALTTAFAGLVTVLAVAMAAVALPHLWVP
ncbi:sulfite exporter TauE/SafE family protein [Streptomyces sp. TM32]|uniref:sulfite exporter TauE/SafE family protein n=1 Tax=Streptomyces sp. TM32 TaxID=1652669 RepID=UPI001011A3FA|nr:sulfite exporter TauE/SafE family protein [Streptomyces sp. TM32]RXS66791.1 sulfite exporter TauE/SafE family protein [Streptomyces sp. TM32]